MKCKPAQLSMQQHNKRRVREIASKKTTNIYSNNIGKGSFIKNISSFK
jgi:hypothetical protein